MIKLKNISKETLIARADGIADVYMLSGDTHEFESAMAEQLIVVHAPNLVKVIDVPLKHQDETEQSEKIVEQEVPREIPTFAPAKKTRKPIIKIKKSIKRRK